MSRRLLLAATILASGCASGPPLRNVPPADAVEPLVRAGRKVENAIAATKLLIERSRSADYLPDLHMRLAELYTEQARYAWLAMYEKRRSSNMGADSRALDVPAARLLKNLAVGTYEVILHDFPKYAKADEALFLMAHEYRELGEFERMKQTYEKLIADYPKSPHRPEAWLILGDTAFDAGDLDRAEKNYNSVLAAASPGAGGRVQPLARYKLAWVRINKEDCKGAASLFEKILRDRGTPRGTQALVATQRRLDLHREALVDLAYCYPEVYPDKPAGPYMRSLADNSSDYIAAMRRVAKRFALKEMYAQAAAALREVLGAAVADEAAIEDARKLYDNVLKAKVFDFAAFDVERIGRVFEHRYHDYRLTKDQRGKLLDEFEACARDIATRSQLAARERRSQAMHAVAAAAYGHYLDYFRVAPDAKTRQEMVQNRAEALAEADRPFEAARAYERVAEIVAEADPRRQARTNAIASYQQALDRGTLSRTERLVAWGGIRAQGRALVAEYPKDDSTVKIKLGVARTFYDAGEYPAAAELFMALARQYPVATEGVAAAHLALDSMRLAENYDRLATLGRQLLAMDKLGDAKFKQEVEGIIAKAEQRQVAELTIASSDDKQERLLSYAKRFKGSGLGEQALYNALLVARTEGDIDRFYALGEEFIQQYPRSGQRIEVMGALASAASDRGDFAQAAQYLEATYQADPRGKDALVRLDAAAQIRAVLSDPKVVDDVKEMLARGAPRGQVDEVLLQSARVGNLPAVEEILLSSRLQSDHRPALNDEVELLGLAAEEAARVGIAIDGQLVAVHGDQRLLRRVIRNMVENAVRYSGGTANVEVTVAARRDCATVDVLDRGPGVPEAERERIFEPFYRAKGASERAGGVGLGLSLARQIAHEHGGELQCLQREGGGGHFRLSLPC